MLFVSLSFPVLPQLGLAEDYTGEDEVKKEEKDKKKEEAKTDQKKKVKIDEIVVTATRTEKDPLSVPAFVTVLSHQELVNTGGRNLVEALKFTPGLTYYAYGPMGISHGGMNSEISIRGTRGGALILINGVPITTPAHGSYDLDQIPLDAVEKVEIVRGSASTLYGSDAFAGVINIITRKAGDMNNTVGLEGGNYGYLNGSAGFRYKDFGMVGSYRRSGDIDTMARNYRSKNNYDFKGSDTYNAYLTYQILDELRFNYSYCYQNAEFDEVYWDTAKPSSLARQNDQKHFANLIYDNKSLKINGFFNYDDLSYKYVTKGDTSTTRSSSSGIDSQYSWQFGAKSDLLAGVTYKYDHADTTEAGKHHKNNLAPFLSFSYELFPKFTATVGARQQWVFQDEGENQSEFCPQFQTIYEITPAFSWYINVGKAFKMPTFTQLYYESSWFVGNPNLKPENGWTYETGIKFRGPSFAFSLAPYYMDFEDKIEYEFDMITYKGSYANMSEFTNKGVEYNFQYFINNNWELSVGGYWGDPVLKKQDEEEQAGPKFQVTPAVGYHGEKLAANLNAVFTTSRENGLSSFQTVGANISYKLWKGALTLAVDNIFNRTNVMCGTMSPTPYYEYYAMSRNFRIGYKMEF